MQGMVETANDIIYASRRCVDDGRERFNTAGKSLWEHGLSQNAFSAHARPDPALNVIGPAVGVSLNTDVVKMERVFGTIWTVG